MKKISSTKPLSFAYLTEEYSDLFETPSYPGGESTAADIIKRTISRHIEADFSNDINGNLVVRINPSVPTTIVFEAHIDRVAAGVCNVGNDGRIYTHPIGRLELNRFCGNLIYLIDKNGNKTHAIIGGNTKIPGIASTSESVWLDTGNQQNNIEIGDIAQFLNKPKGLSTHLSASGLDNIAGIICLIEMAKNATGLDKGFILWFSTKEEIGAITLPKFDLCHDARFISVDTCFSADCNDISGNLIGIQSIGCGPIVLYDPNCSKDLNEEIIQLACSRNIRVQKYHNIVPGHGLTVTSPALAQLNARRSCLLLPIRYMHSPLEVCSFDDMNKMIDLLCTIAYEN